MLSEQLIKYLNKPGKLNSQSLSILEEWVEEYPFFQTAHLLRIKNIQNLNHQVEKSILNHTATYVTDRKVLYYLLHKLPVIERESSDYNGEIHHPYEKEIKESLEENIHDTIHKQRDIYDLEPEHEIELIPGLAIDVKKEYGNGIDLEDINFSLQGVKPDLFEILDDEQLVTIEERTDTEILEDLGGPILELDDDVEEPSDDLAQAAVEETIVEGLETKTPLNISESSGEPVYYASEEELYSMRSRSFTDWLDSLNAQEDIFSAGQEDKTIQKTYSQKSPEASDRIRMEIPYDLNRLRDENPDEQISHSNKNEKNSLIDQFIQTNPKIIPKDRGTEHKDFSADSIKEHESFFTDTLARIYIKQGNYAKAILAYEKLSLKYPEKSTYFAGQISEIRKLISKS